VGPGGATVELQAGVNLSFLESNAAARIVSPAGGGLTLNATTGSGTLAKAYVGTGGLLKTGTGTWTITGNNTFAGDTRILAGTLRVTGTASLAGSTLDLNAVDTGTITLASGSARTFSLGGLAGTRSLSSGSHTLRIGGNGQTTVYSGSLDGVGGLVKTGTGMLSLGGITTLTGGLVVEEGILRFTGSASMPTAGPIRIDSGGTLAPVAGAAVDAWLSAGRIDTASAGAIAISGSLGAALDLRDFPGLSLGGSGSATFGGSLLPGASGYRLGGGDGSLVVSAALGGMNPLMKVGADTVILTGMNSFSGGILLRGGLLQAGSAAALGSSGTISFQGGGLQSSAANAADFSGRFSRSAGQDFRIDTNGRSITFAEPLVSAGGSLTKLGSGTLAIAATNGFDGTTRIVGGVLQVAGTAAAGGDLHPWGSRWGLDGRLRGGCRGGIADGGFWCCHGCCA
jgi:autotransporter-associated beta strand protein